MRSTRHLVHVAAAAVMVCSLAAHAEADSGTAPDLSKFPVCKMDFALAYSHVGNEATTISSYLKQKEVPPNTVEGVLACAKIESLFPGMTCGVPEMKTVISTADFKQMCEGMRQLYKQFANQDAPTKIPTTAAVTDATAVPLVDAARLTLQVQKLVDAQKAVDQSGTAFFINGTVFEFKDSLLQDADIRCSIKRPKAASVALKASQVLKAVSIDASYVSGTRALEIMFDQGNLSLTCVSTGDSVLTLGQVKAALGSVMTLSYR